MQLFVGLEKGGSYSRFFVNEKISKDNLILFDNFNFYINNTEFKYYDIETFDEYVLCNIDLKPLNDKWRTITDAKKQKLSYKSLENIKEDNQLHLYKVKGIDYMLSGLKLYKNKILIENYNRENKGLMTESEIKLIETLLSFPVNNAGSVCF